MSGVFCQDGSFQASLKGPAFCFASVSRTFTLDESVDQDAAQAKYENGVLQLTLPKKHNGQSHILKIA